MENDNFSLGSFISLKHSCYLLLVVVLINVILFICNGCNEGFERKAPRTVTYREKVSDTDTSEIWRNVIYELVNVSYDTIPKKRERSTLVVPKTVRAEFMPLRSDDRVDLNDYLSWIDEETDWNYTEIGEYEQMVLDNAGIYWDKDKGYWRKRK